MNIIDKYFLIHTNLSGQEMYLGKPKHLFFHFCSKFIYCFHEISYYNMYISNVSSMLLLS